METIRNGKEKPQSPSRSTRVQKPRPLLDFPNITKTNRSQLQNPIPFSFHQTARWRTAFVDDEIQAAESLIALSESRHRPVTRKLPRWAQQSGDPFPETAKVERLSPSTAALVPASGVTRLPSSSAAAGDGEDLEEESGQHKEWVKEQNQTIATLSATKASLHSGAHNLRQRRLQSSRGTKRRAGSVPVGPAGPRRCGPQPAAAATGSDRSSERRRRRRGAAREERQRAAAYAQARKRRIELQRVKSSLKIQRLR
ncbi:uncharacterized protein A4U43_C08F4590 [Asparagus officinalis]|nr:uncharacterized protein A4U43_C08F4590 [Asparagus officinalis]